MRIFTGQVVDVQRYHSVVDKALKEFLNQIDIERADSRARE